MDKIFLYILNNAITVSFLIIAIIVVRFLGKKMPKWSVCLLWLAVAIKLIIPFHIESAISLIPSGEPIPANIALETSPQINSGINSIDSMVNPVIQQNFAANETASANPLQIYLCVGMLVWIAGVIGMFLYAAISYILIKRKVSASIKTESKVYECDYISDPFILGIINPKIYIPSGLAKGAKDYILKHEFAHLSRLDYIWKPLGFAILSVYWFNPLCWVAYILLCRDIEYACDEKATKDIKKEDKAEYCKVLLDYSMPKKMITACPVAFGETDVKNRVKNIASYKKTTFLVAAISIIIFIVVGVCFATSRAGASKNCPIGDISSEKMYGMSVAYVPNLLTIDKEDAKIISDTLASAKWTMQEENAQIPDGEFYSLFVYNSGNPFRLNFYADDFATFEQNNTTAKYIIELDDESLIYNIVNPQDMQEAVNNMIEFAPEEITVTGVWEADARKQTEAFMEEQINAINEFEAQAKEQKETSDVYKTQMEEQAKNAELQKYYEEIEQYKGEVINNVKYEFDDFYVEPRWYVFDGSNLYYAYDIVNGNDTSEVIINPKKEDAEVTYYVSNDGNPDRTVMWAIIHFNKPCYLCEIEIGAKESDTKYYWNLVINKSEADVESNTVSTIKTYYVTDPEKVQEYFEDDKLVTMTEYSKLSDGTWKCEDIIYKYRLEITGRMGGAVKDSTFVYLSNIENITFDQAWKAAGYSSNMNDYFDVREAKLVEMK